MLPLQRKFIFSLRHDDNDDKCTWVYRTRKIQKATTSVDFGCVEEFYHRQQITLYADTYIYIICKHLSLKKPKQLVFY